MSETFKQLKKKYLQSALFKSAALGLSAGLLSSGAVLLALKLSKIAIAPWYYVIIGIGAALLAGIPLFFAFHRNDARLARHLDGEYGLDEKVQTMVAYREDSGDMIELQRQDAAEKLGALPKRSFKEVCKKLWYVITAFLLSVAVFVTAVALPFQGKKTPIQPPPPDGDAFAITPWQISSLEQMIAEIEDSRLENGLKSSVKGVLETLLAQLRETEKKSVMKMQVSAAVSSVDAFVVSVNSYKRIGDAFAADERTKQVSDAIATGIAIYRSLQTGFGSINNVESAWRDLTGENTEELGKMDASLAETLKKVKESYTDLGGDGLRDVLGGLKQGTEGALSSLGEGDGDALHGGAIALGNALTEAESMLETSSASKVRARLDTAVDAFAEAAGDALCVQAYNCMIDEFVPARLAEIFAIDPGELPALLAIPPRVQGGDDPETGEPDPGTNPGGYGDGDLQYGSDEEIYDPDFGGYIKYGEVVDYYFRIAQELADSGDLTESQKKILLEYFDRLLGGSKEPETEK
jgi:hypothetical protein